MTLPITQEQYDEIRTATLAYLIKITPEPFVAIDKLTCDNCPYRLQCEFAGDAYNTNGDCLAEK